MTIQEIIGDDNPNTGRDKLNSNFDELDGRTEGLEAGLAGEVILKLSNAEGDFDWRNPADAAIKGDPGEGVPAGGTTGQLLAKDSGTDYDTEWIDASDVGSRAAWDPVNAATLTDITLSGEQTIDGVSLVADDRCLVWQQSDFTENGIYVVASGAWSRATDADESEDFLHGKTTFIVDGGVENGNQIAFFGMPAPFTLDTDAVVFVLAIAHATETQYGTAITATQTQVDDAEGGTELMVTPEKLAAYPRIYRNLVTISSDVTNATTSFADVTGLSFPVDSGTVYRFEFIIAYSVNATTTGSQWSINGPSTSLLAYEAQWYTAASTLTSRSSNAYNSIGGAGSDTPATTGNIAKIKGIIKPSASGTVIARFASEVAVASALVAKAGSMVEYW